MQSVSPFSLTDLLLQAKVTHNITMGTPKRYLLSLETAKSYTAFTWLHLSLGPTYAGLQTRAARAVGCTTARP